MPPPRRVAAAAPHRVVAPPDPRHLAPARDQFRPNGHRLSTPQDGLPAVARAARTRAPRACACRSPRPWTRRSGSQGVHVIPNEERCAPACRRAP